MRGHVRGHSPFRVSQGKTPGRRRGRPSIILPIPKNLTTYCALSHRLEQLQPVKFAEGRSPSQGQPLQTASSSSSERRTSWA